MVLNHLLRMVVRAFQAVNATGTQGKGVTATSGSRFLSHSRSPWLDLGKPEDIGAEVVCGPMVVSGSRLRAGRSDVWDRFRRYAIGR